MQPYHYQVTEVHTGNRTPTASSRNTVRAPETWGDLPGQVLRLAKIFLDPFDNDGATDGGKTGVAISVENLLQEVPGDSALTDNIVSKTHFLIVYSVKKCIFDNMYRASVSERRCFLGRASASTVVYRASVSERRCL